MWIELRDKRTFPEDQEQHRTKPLRLGPFGAVKVTWRGIEADGKLIVSPDGYGYRPEGGGYYTTLFMG